MTSAARILHEDCVFEAGSEWEPLPHAYEVRLNAGMLARIAIDQGDVDLSMSVVACNRSCRYDQRERGLECISLFSREQSVCRLQVDSLHPKLRSARYRLAIRFSIGKTCEDSLRMSAERLTTTAKQAAGERSASSARRALACYTKAVTMWRHLGEHAAEASAALNIGELQYFQGECELAVGAFRQAAHGFLACDDRRGVAEAQNGMGLACRQLGRIEEASQVFHSALECWTSIGHAAGEAATLSNIGVLSYETGEWQDALDRFSKAKRIARSLGNVEARGFAAHNIAGVHRALGQHRRALAQLKFARRAFRNAKNTRAEARAMLSLAQVHLVVGELRLAETSGQRALELFTRLGDRKSTADVLRHLGQLLEKEGRAPEAADYHARALDAYRALGNRPGEAAALYGLGNVCISLERYGEALRLLGDARRVQKRLGTADGQAETLFAIARIASRRSRLNAARVHAEAAIRIAEQLRTQVAGIDLRTSYFSHKHDYYGFCIELLMRLHQDQPSAGFAVRAFELSERARARGLLDLLAKPLAEMPRPGGAGSAEADRLERRIRFWSFRRARAVSQGDAEEAARATQQLAPLLEAWQDSEARGLDLCADMNETVPCDLARVQSDVLDPDTALLQYAFGENRCYLWVITTKTVDSFDLGAEAAVEHACRSFYAMSTSSRGSRRPDNVENCRVAAQNLSALLLPPGIAPALRQKLVISAEGVLRYVPFAALVHPLTSQTLALDYEIVSIPSVSTIGALRRPPVCMPAPAKTAAVVADPVFDLADPRILSRNSVACASTSEGGVDGLTRLLFSRQEASAILDLLPAEEVTMVMDFEANASVMRTEILAEHRIIHFASHALVDDDAAGLSCLVLTLVAPDGTPRDGLIGLKDILRLRLRADLVVLSACRTGLGVEVRGEGIVGLTRAFFHAGAARVLVSLWKVDDEATSVLMRHFYTALLGPRKASAPRALGMAQSEMLRSRRWSHPYYWAGFAIQGEWR